VKTIKKRHTASIYGYIRDCGIGLWLKLNVGPVCGAPRHWGNTCGLLFCSAI